MHVHRRIASLVSLFAACAVGGHAAAQDGSKKVADTHRAAHGRVRDMPRQRGRGHRRRNYYPRLAGKPARYLYLQLVAFREGRRTYPQMVYLLRYMPDAYLQEIADYYAKLAPPYPPPSQVAMSTREIERAETARHSGRPGEESARRATPVMARR